MTTSYRDCDRIGLAAATRPGVTVERLADGRFAAVRRAVNQAGAVGPPEMIVIGTEAEAERAAREEVERGRGDFTFTKREIGYSSKPAICRVPNQTRPSKGGRVLRHEYGE